MKLYDVYPLLSITPVSAHGQTIVCTDGKEYLDLYGGHAVISVGHSHPVYVQRLKEQLDKIAFYSNAVRNPLQEELAEKMGALSGYHDYFLFLCNSGAEANENALKLASFKNGRKKIVAFNGSFHGRTSAAVAATHDEKINAQLNFQHEVEFAELNNLEEAILKIDNETCAVIIEGIQGVAGVIEPTNEFLQHLRKLCNATGAILILDEVQSGCGRTGNYFAHQSSGVKPDLITMAKGIGNGFPIGAVLISPQIQAKHGQLGTTFGGNYLACVSALAVIDIIENESLMTNASLIGNYLMKKISSFSGIKEVRGKGLMIGIEFEENCAPIRKTLLEEHLLFTGSSSCKKTIRLLPPLTITLDEANRFLFALENVLIHQPTTVLS